MVDTSNDEKSESPEARLALDLTKDQARMLWQLLNLNIVTTPVSESAIAADLFARVKSIAKSYGLLET